MGETRFTFTVLKISSTKLSNKIGNKEGDHGNIRSCIKTIRQNTMKIPCPIHSENTAKFTLRRAGPNEEAIK